MKLAATDLESKEPSSEECSVVDETEIVLPSVVDVGIDDSEEHTAIAKSEDTTKGTMVILCLCVMFGGAFNNVLGKIRSKPFGVCNYFVSILNAFAYSVIYFCILKYRIYTGRIGKEQIDFVWSSRKSRSNTHNFVHASGRSSLSRPLLSSVQPYNPGRSKWQQLKARIARVGVWKYFVLSGFCDVMGNVIAMIAQPFVPGPLFALMNQATLPAAAIVSMLLLRKRYSTTQLCAILLVWMGGALALVPDLIRMSTDPTRKSQESLTIRYSLLVVLGTVPTALSSAVKEKVFRLYAKKQKKKEEDALPMPKIEMSESIDDNLRDRRRLNTQLVQERLREIKPTEAWCTNRTLSAALMKEQPQTLQLKRPDAPAGASKSIQEKQQLDVFVISTYGSFFQLLFVPLTFPANLLLGQFQSHSILTYFRAGIECLLGMSTQSTAFCHPGLVFNQSFAGLGAEPLIADSAECLGTGITEACEASRCCQWAPLAYPPYLAVNVAFNVLLLCLVVNASAVVAFMTLKAVLPLAIIMFAMVRWPLLTKEDSRVSVTILMSLVIVCTGIFWFRQTSKKQALDCHSSQATSVEASQGSTPPH